MTGIDVLEIVKFDDCETDPLADSLGTDPVTLANGCGCDRPRYLVLPCGHCSCRSECTADDCRTDKIWAWLDEWNQDSWCGCAQPGKEVLRCGHCACDNGLCWEWVNVGPDRPFEKRRKASCA